MKNEQKKITFIEIIYCIIYVLLILINCLYYIDMKELKNENIKLHNKINNLLNVNKIKDEKIIKLQNMIEHQNKLNKLKINSNNKTSFLIPMENNSKITKMDVQKINKISNFIKSVNSNLTDNEIKYISYCLVDAGNTFKINPYLLTGIAYAESTFKTRSVSSAGAIGLMQIHWDSHGKNLISTFKSINCRNDLFKPKNGIFAGAYIFKWYLINNKNNIELALNRYLSADSPKYRKKILTVKNNLENMK